MKPSAKQLEQFKQFLIKRFAKLKNARIEFDEKMENIEAIYNNTKDYEREVYQEDVKTGTAFTLIKTVSAFLNATLFPEGQDTVVISGETGEESASGNQITKYANSIIEHSKLSKAAPDILDNALKYFVSWIQLIPKETQGRFKVEIATPSFINVWCDFRREDSDFFVRSIKGYLDLKLDKEYINQDKIKNTVPPDDLISIEDQAYKTSSGVSYYSPEVDNNNDDVEVLTWYGRYDINEDGELEDMIGALGNQKELIRCDENDLKTDRKILIFPIIAIRDSKTFIGKSVVDLFGTIFDNINDAASWRQDNFRLLVQGLFKYDRNYFVDHASLFAAGGNAIPTDNIEALQAFVIPNVLNVATGLMNSYTELAQLGIGATDIVMGTALGKGLSETARGITTTMQNAMTKINDVAITVARRFLEVIKFIIILYNKNDKDNKRVKKFGVEKFLELTELEIEEDYLYNYNFKNLATDVDRRIASFVNAVNMSGKLLSGVGGDVKFLLKTLFKKFELTEYEIQGIMGETPEFKAEKEKQMEGIQKMMGGGGSSMVQAQAKQGAEPPAGEQGAV